MTRSLLIATTLVLLAGGASVHVGAADAVSTPAIEAVGSSLSFDRVSPLAAPVEDHIVLRVGEDAPSSLRILHTTSDDAVRPVLSLRVGSGPWTVMRSGYNDLLLPPARTGRQLRLDARVEAGWDVPAGSFRGDLRLLVDDVEAAVIDYSAAVEPVVELIPDGLPFELTVFDSAHPDRVMSEPRTFKVLSNASWVMTLLVDERPASVASQRVVDDELAVIVDDGPQQTNSRFIAVGEATGTTGRELRIRLACHWRKSAPAAGRYVGRVRFTAEPAAP